MANIPGYVRLRRTYFPLESREATQYLEQSQDLLNALTPPRHYPPPSIRSYYKNMQRITKPSGTGISAAQRARAESNRKKALAIRAERAFEQALATMPLPMPVRYAAPPRSSSELNWVDFAPGPLLLQAITTPPTPHLLTAVAQGASANQRVGLKYSVKSIQFEFNVYATASVVLSAGAVIPDPIIRMVIIYDNSPNKTVPTLADIYNTTTGVQCLRNPQYENRFRTIRDVTVQNHLEDITIGGNAVIASGRAMFSGYNKVDLPVKCTGATAGIGDIAEGAILLYIWTEAAALTTFTLYWDGSARIRYVDL